MAGERLCHTRWESTIKREAKRADGKQAATPAATVGKRQTRKRISVYFQNCRQQLASQSENPAA